MKSIHWFVLLSVVFSTLGASCKTKKDVKREQEYEKIKQEVREARGARADLDVISEEFRTELVRLSSQVEEQGQMNRVQGEDFRKEVSALAAKVQTLEQQIAKMNEAPPAKPVKAASYENAKALFEKEAFDESIEECKTVMRSKPKNSPEVRKAHYLLAEAYFASGDFGAAALEFSEFKRAYPKDPGLSNATLRQAQAFKGMGKQNEAKLFYQEVIEKFPKSQAATQAKKELKKK